MYKNFKMTSFVENDMRKSFVYMVMIRLYHCFQVRITKEKVQVYSNALKTLMYHGIIILLA